MSRYVPKVGTYFEDVDELEKRLVRSGWKYDGHESFYHYKTRKRIGETLFVSSEGGNTRLGIVLGPYQGKLKVVALQWRGEGGRRQKGRRVGRGIDYESIPGLDPEIVELVRDLNEAGYITEYSCAGHEKPRRKGIGFINFSRVDFTKDELAGIREIFRENGIAHVTFKVYEDFTKVTFPGVG